MKTQRRLWKAVRQLSLPPGQLLVTLKLVTAPGKMLSVAPGWLTLRQLWETAVGQCVRGSGCGCGAAVRGFGCGCGVADRDPGCGCGAADKGSIVDKVEVRAQQMVRLGDLPDLSVSAGHLGGTGSRSRRLAACGGCGDSRR